MYNYNPYGRDIAEFYPVSWFNFHIWFWLLTSIYSVWYFMFFDLSWDVAIVSKLTFLPFQLIAAYVLLLKFLRGFLFRDKYVEFILVSIVWILFFSYITFFLCDQVIYNWMSNEHVAKPFIEILTDFERLFDTYLRVVFLLPLILASFDIIFYLYAKLKLVNKESHRKRAVESSFQKLRFKSDFIVDTLNSLSTMIEKKDDRSLKVVERLSGALDFILYKGNNHCVSLLEEVESVSNYCELEEIRAAGRCEIQLLTDLSKSDYKIKPLYLLSFVEGILRPLINHRKEKKDITIEIGQQENAVYCSMSIEGLEEMYLEECEKMIPTLPYDGDSDMKVNVDGRTVIFILEIHNLKND